MSKDEFVRAVRQVSAYTGYVYFHLMGEPFLHPCLSDFLEICAQENVKVNITTNGTLIASVQKVLLQAPALRKVGFSLHSFEANASARVLEEYLADITTFVEAAKDMGIICELRLWNVDADARNGQNSLNLHILDLLSKNLRLDIGEALTASGSVKLRDRLYLGFAEIFDWPDIQRDAGNPEGFCYGLRDQIGILADGTVVPCCLDSEGVLALGNVFRESLSDILASARAQAIYDGFSQRKAVEELCRRCGFAHRFLK